MKDVRAILIAGGDSTRLWPISDKHFVHILGKPLIYHCIIQLIRCGITDIVVVTPKDRKEIFDIAFSDIQGATIHIVEQHDPRGMAGAIISASELIQAHEILIVSPADVYEDILLHDFKNLIKEKPSGIMAGVYRETYFPGGYLTVDNGIVKGIIEKPDEKSVPSNIVNFVFHYYRNGSLLLKELNSIRSEADDVYERVVDRMIKNGFIFKFLPYKGYWGYIKYPWHILSLSAYFLSGMHTKHGNAHIDPTASLEGHVVLGEGVRIMDHVKIVGPVYIGAGTIVGSNSLIRDSVIGDNCVIGFSTDIARSYIGHNCWFHKNYIGDSVLSDNVCMGAGAVLANFRLDEKNIQTPVGKSRINTQRNKLGAMIGANVRIGVNSSIMPGIKIGKNTFIGSGVTVNEDIGEGKYCVLSKNQYVIKENTSFGLDNSNRKIDASLKKGK